MNKIRVAVIFGGRSGEHEISIRSARHVLSGFDSARYEVIPLCIARDGTWLSPPAARAALAAGAAESGEASLAVLPGSTSGGLVPLPGKEALEGCGRPDVVFPVLHGTYGEDGAIQGLLEMAGIPYIGAGVAGSAVGMDKALMKSIWAAHGLPVLPFETVLRSNLEQDEVGLVDSLLESIGLPCFVKPANLGSSVGIRKASSRDELAQALVHAALYDRKMVVEKACSRPRELEVAMIGNDDPQVSVVGEVVHSADFYDYRTKYHDATSHSLIPAPLSPEQAAQVEVLAVRAWRALDLNGMTRVDFLMEADSGKIWLNEVNTIPGFTEISMFARLWEASGLPFPRLLDRLVELAFQRHQDRQRNLVRPDVLAAG
ncbi:MAG TPA: D-alanine--D-alanine ligase family protein [Candidatus Nitrosotenuis sp.]|jgi:D-alanine-D-alanine ligase|nr:D-alanine--D-alanine ligase family protein [Candidatus Nitrosotenuis sp.]